MSRLVLWKGILLGGAFTSDDRAGVSAYPRNRCRFLLVLACVIGTTPLGAAVIGVATTQPLSFGKFVAGAGSVTLHPSGARSAGGSVVLLTSDPGQAAQFSVSGDAAATYAVTLPGNGSVVLSNGSSNMPVNGFVSSPASSGTLSGGGTQILNVGATLEIAAGQQPGAYSGSFNVIVDYN